MFFYSLNWAQISPFSYGETRFPDDTHRDLKPANYIDNGPELDYPRRSLRSRILSAPPIACRHFCETLASLQDQQYNLNRKEV